MSPQESRLVILGILVFLVLLWTGILYVVAETSGWRRMRRLYGMDGEFAGEKWEGERGYMRWAAFRGMLTAGANKEGLYLKIQAPFHFFCRPLFIPWKVIRVEAKRQWSVDGVVFHLGTQQPVEFWVHESMAEKLREASL